MKALKNIRIIALLMSVMFCLSTIVYADDPGVETNIKTYALKSSGRITTYLDPSMSSSDGYIDAATDEINVLRVRDSDRKVQVSYPTSAGQKVRWIWLSELTTSTVGPSFAVSKRVNTYRRSDLSQSYGYADPGDIITVLDRGPSVSQISYPSYNGVYKWGWVRTSDIYPSQDTSAGDWQMPLSDAYVCGNDWGEYYSQRPSRPYHSGLDLGSRSNINTVYAAANGTVVNVGYNSVNGYYVVLQHKMKSGNTVYSYYLHLSNYSVSNGTTVEKGQNIGVVGSSGTGAVGHHLHFAICSGLFSSGGIWGYVDSINGDRASYQGDIYYNPHFVVANNRLP